MLDQSIVEQVGVWSARTLVFVPEVIESISLGWRGREIYTVNESKELTAVLDLAESGKEFELCTKAKLVKTK